MTDITQNGKKQTVVIVDGNNSLYRMYHTRPPKVKSDERVESAEGLINEIRGLAKGSISDEPDAVIVVFDAKGKNFRHDLREDYKAERKGMPEELKTQELLAKRSLEALGIPVLEQKGVEADDVIGMLAKHYESRLYDVIVYTNDKDIHQLINDNIRLYNSVSKKMMDEKAVVDKFGVGPDRIADLLALMGDDSDGIKGIYGVGIGTAAKWIKAHGSLEGIIENSDKIKGVVGNNLRDSLEMLPINKKMTTLITCQYSLSEESTSRIDNASYNAKECADLQSLYGFNLTPIKAREKTLNPTSPMDSRETEDQSRAPEQPEQGMLF